jgi:DNA-binding NarL/FixJ family response regulator
MNAIKIFLVNDNPLDCSGIEAILSRHQDLRVVGVAQGLDQACRIGGQLEPDVFIVEVSAVMPGLAQMVGRLADRGRPNVVPTLILTQDTRQQRLALLRSSCSVLRRRDVSAVQLVAAIRLTAAGYLLVERPLALRLVSGSVGMLGDDPKAHLAVDLTSRQREVFELMAGGLSNAEIARALAVAESTVKSHVKGILAKLGLRNRVQAAIYANRLHRPAQAATSDVTIGANISPMEGFRLPISRR